MQKNSEYVDRLDRKLTILDFQCSTLWPFTKGRSLPLETVPVQLLNVVLGSPYCTEDFVGCGVYTLAALIQ